MSALFFRTNRQTSHPDSAANPTATQVTDSRGDESARPEGPHRTHRRRVGHRWAARRDRARRRPVRRGPRARHHRIGPARLRRRLDDAGGPLAAVDRPAPAVGVRPGGVHGARRHGVLVVGADRQRGRMGVAASGGGARRLDDRPSPTRAAQPHPGVGPVPGVRRAAALGGRRHLRDLPRDRRPRTYPMPGRLVDVGGHKLHIDCTGTGSPTVVLEPGLGEAVTRDGLDRPRRRHDHPGLRLRPRRSRLEPIRPRRRRTASRSPPICTRCCDRAGEHGPYVLAGHSAGGLYVLNFAHLYPNQIAGVVLLDSMHPEQYPHLLVLGLLRDVPPSVGGAAVAVPPRRRSPDRAGRVRRAARTVPRRGTRLLRHPTRCPQQPRRVLADPHRDAPGRRTPQPRPPAPRRAHRPQGRRARMVRAAERARRTVDQQHPPGARRTRTTRCSPRTSTPPHSPATRSGRSSSPSAPAPPFPERSTDMNTKTLTTTIAAGVGLAITLTACGGPSSDHAASTKPVLGVGASNIHPAPVVVTAARAQRPARGRGADRSERGTRRDDPALVPGPARYRHRRSRLHRPCLGRQARRDDEPGRTGSATRQRGCGPGADHDGTTGGRADAGLGKPDGLVDRVGTGPREQRIRRRRDRPDTRHRGRQRNARRPREPRTPARPGRAPASTSPPAAQIRTLAGPVDADRIAVGGHSIAGAIAYQVAIDRPTRPRRVRPRRMAARTRTDDTRDGARAHGRRLRARARTRQPSSPARPTP